MPSSRQPLVHEHGSLSAIVALVFGVVLVGLAAPHLIAGFAELPARPVLEEMRKGVVLDDQYFEFAIDSKAASLGWISEGRGWASLGLLHFTAARRDGLATTNGRAKLAQSVMADRRAVSLSPGQAYAWARLARAELLRHGPSPRVALLLERAIAQAPYDPALVFGRLELSFLARRPLAPAMNDMVAEQVRFAARIAPQRLASLSRERYAMTMVRDALADTPELRRQVDYYLRRF